MALNNSNSAVIDDRRLNVARLRLRGFTQREIVAGLERARVVNPKTGGAWSLGTINADIAALEAQWQAAAVDAIDEAKAKQLAEIREARRAAWTDKNMSEVRQLIKLEMELLGTAAPSRSELTGKDGDALNVVMTWGDG